MNRFTPHARGSTPVKNSRGKEVIVYPACAGIDRFAKAGKSKRRSLPRMRGDRPLHKKGRSLKQAFTPHARGSTCSLSLSMQTIFVYPACAGIDPFSALASSSFAGLPRMRGDRPLACLSESQLLMFTPHARGSTVRRTRLYKTYKVYPACAGIDQSRRPRKSG